MELLAYQQLEKEFADYIGTEYAVACSSGTAALTLALAGLGIGPGDQVIVPEFTMIACAWAVEYVGAEPVFVDCRDDLNIDVTKIKEKITLKTKAIMPVHIYGRMVDMRAINSIAEVYGLYVIEDAAEAHGAFNEESSKAGSLGTVGCFSLFRNKIVQSGEGGVVTTNDGYLHKRMCDLKSMSFGERHDYYHEQMGYNFRMSDYQAEVAIESLRNIDQEIERRWEQADLLDKDYEILTLDRPQGSVIWVYDMLFPTEQKRDQFMQENVNTRHFFKPMSMQPMYDLPYEHLRAYDFSKRGAYIQI